MYTNNNVYNNIIVCTMTFTVFVIVIFMYQCSVYFIQNTLIKSSPLYYSTPLLITPILVKSNNSFVYTNKTSPFYCAPLHVTPNSVD